MKVLGLRANNWGSGATQVYRTLATRGSAAEHPLAPFP